MRLSSSGKWLIAAASLAAVATVVALGGVYFLSTHAPVPVVAMKPVQPPNPQTSPVIPTATAPQSTSRAATVASVAADSLERRPRSEENATGPVRIAPEFKLGRQLPVGWTAQRSESPQRHETVICFEVPGHPGIAPSVLYHGFSEPTLPWGPDLRAWLSEAAEAKAAQRVREGWSNYQNRPQMLPRVIGNRAALSWSAEFIRDGEPWVENLTRLFSPAGTALFFLKAPAREIDEVQSLFDIVIESTEMPSLVKTTDVAVAR